MAGNYVIVANFCDRAGPFLKFQKNRHISARKLRFRFHLKTGGFRFRFENHHSTNCEYVNEMYTDKVACCILQDEYC